LVVIVDRVSGASEGNARDAEQSNWLFFSEDEGKSWSEPVATPMRGIVPDKLVVLKSGPWAGRWILSSHTAVEGVWANRGWISDDQGGSWRGPVLVASEPKLLLCEGNIVEMPGGELVCFLRENSFAGLDGFKAISRDGGETWGRVHALASPGMHRPVGGVLQDGRVLITHRYVPGGRTGWGYMTQNTFATFLDVASCLEEDRSRQGTRVMPLDYDRSPVSDGGYTGWVQFADGEIYIVNYIVDDAPKGQIRGYSIKG
jgi:sialidase-1